MSSASAAPDGCVRRWWEPKSDCLSCVRNRRHTSSTAGRQNGVLPTAEPVQEDGLPRVVNGVRVCEPPLTRPGSVQRANDRDRPAESARVSRVPVARPVEGGRVHAGTPVATVEAAWPVGPRGDGTMYMRRGPFGDDSYYSDPYYHDPYYRRRYGYGPDPVVPLLGGLLLADLLLF